MGERGWRPRPGQMWRLHDEYWYPPSGTQLLACHIGPPPRYSAGPIRRGKRQHRQTGVDGAATVLHRARPQHGVTVGRNTV
jgi:hypothetical protein